MQAPTDSVADPLADPVPTPVAELDQPVAELDQPVAELNGPIAQASPAPLMVRASGPQVLGLPLQLLNQLLVTLRQARLDSLVELLPALKLVALLVAAGFVVRLTGATLDALNDIPMLGRLLELVGLISALNFLARNALRSQKRAELLARIMKLRQDLLG
jgi:hypothetical protein